jgi:hypothetical protein
MNNNIAIGTYNDNYHRDHVVILGYGSDCTDDYF